MSHNSNAELEFDWYRVFPCSVSLEQGDFLNNFPIPIPPAEISEVPAEPVGLEIKAPYTIERFNIVVMTQSCDLQNFSDNDEVILCPRVDYLIAASENKKFEGKDGWNKLINGRFIGAYIVNMCEIENHVFDYQVIDLQRIFSIPLYIVNQVAYNHGDRVRLLPPYRERLAQAFARQFMRVGLPIDLPREYPYISQT